jgi:L-2-hydroxyglutarate oxidase
MSSNQYDIAIIGGGIVGLATAMALAKQNTTKVIVLEAEERLAAHQTGNNSGVIHSGIYYKPGSLKARNCVEGRTTMYAFCQDHGVKYDNCGKVIVATQQDELPALDRLYERGQANGLTGLRRLNPQELQELEPHTVGIAAIHVPQTGIVDYIGVCQAYAKIIQDNGGEIQTGARVTALQKSAAEFTLTTQKGEIRAKNLINCSGLQSDRVAKLCGVDPQLQIVPFRGEYYELVPEKHHLVKNLIYPVPDPRFPFLGVHFTRMVKGGVEAGPNAVLAFKREGYKMSAISIGDLLAYAFYGGFWRMAGKYWKTSIGEYYRSFSKAAFVKALQRLLPELQEADVHRSGAGVRAQALDPKGNLLDDFAIREAERQIHVLNAPSPAATASISIGKSIAEMAARNFKM